MKSRSAPAPSPSRIYPAAVKGLGTIGAEAVNDLGKLAMPIMEVDAEISWQERSSDSGQPAPGFRPLRVRQQTSSAAPRQARAKQFFYWCLAQKIRARRPGGAREGTQPVRGLVAQTSRGSRVHDRRCRSLSHVPEVPPFLCNVGGPMARTRTERIFSSLLDRGEPGHPLAECHSAGARFRPGRPAGCRLPASADRRHRKPRSAARLLRDPGRRAAVPGAPAWPIDARTSEPALVLRQALMLGLCTRVLFDPARPVLWTHASLTRRVELYAIENFYDA